ncbi:tRNA-splicing endonuclease subunit Sen15 [Latimeria chalumnae]|uniref:tRNA splicing endonuclease subunit 15 n=1 Tax=Latimeria chalumnae TaxID=7897 RepID=H3AXP3_LATCH|nr:PREDICTED: tRNA-splicing endonuclease subunit Sen15 [Latimeria chalumnae]|eukprot:XP_005996264.2 PREDICTED: tRNA-splicing endonuclease subunit Sen15 [Latimeria chalumnae]
MEEERREDGVAEGEMKSCSVAGESGTLSNWMEKHPKYVELMALDVADCTQVYTAFLVYLDLLEARNWHDVACIGSEELQLIYLQGCERAGDTPQVVIPTPTHESLTHKRIREIMKHCCDQDSREDVVKMSIVLAIVESDFTVVYYKLTDGFVVPDPPDIVEDMDNRRWRKRKSRVC